MLETERLTLRTWTLRDADFVFDMYSRHEVRRYIGRGDVMQEREEAVRLLERWSELQHPIHHIWAVERTVDERVLGVLLLKSIPASGTDGAPSGDTEIGWHLHPDAWGHGYASEAAARVLRFAFEAGLEKVVAVTNPANTASQSVCRRIGMRHKGQTDAYYDTICELFEATP
ncbi:Protein N-acetyltransferase, RimJ/RimL family [Paramicrobacterium humi]|uniref:Protein N-acetyltransferase, RimJ/RimL family n=1 Tax=Paramicrobacterium humi TaxID=640635 RepID=A0A1H4KMP7_9MICO|nr:GNAT family N-acetyltransferase [Microbacterium humi]SEB59780.1 Protein N-acetyltransferase, RimJ/RimL family [Microbacterium humi]